MRMDRENRSDFHPMTKQEQDRSIRSSEQAAKEKQDRDRNKLFLQMSTEPLRTAGGAPSGVDPELHARVQQGYAEEDARNWLNMSLNERLFSQVVLLVYAEAGCGAAGLLAPSMPQLLQRLANRAMTRAELEIFNRALRIEAQLAKLQALEDLASQMELARRASNSAPQLLTAEQQALRNMEPGMPGRHNIPEFRTVKMPRATNLEAAGRLNIPDAATGKVRPGQAATASQLERELGKMIPHTDPTKGDFIITEGPQKGKSVDLMFTADSPKQVEMMNKFFDTNWAKVEQQLTSHLKKADIVPLDFRNLNSAARSKVMEHLKSIDATQRAKVIILE